MPIGAFAQDDPVAAQARARFKEGVDFYDNGSYESARLAFLQAYALKKHPAVLLNLAQSSAKAGHALDAAKYFQQYLKDATTANPQQRQTAESGLAEVRQKLGRIEIIAPAGTEITLDEKERLGTAPLAEPIDVEPGGHALRSPTETVRVLATAGQKVQAKFGASSVAPPPPAPVVAPPPSAESPQPSAEHNTDPPPGTDAGAEHKEPIAMWPGYVGLGVTAAGVVSAIVFAVFKAQAQSNADAVANSIRTKAGSRAPGICVSQAPADVAQFGQACRTLQSNNDDVNLDATAANVSIGVAIAGAIFSTAWLVAVPIANRNRAQSTGWVKNPVFAPYTESGGGGFQLSGSF